MRCLQLILASCLFLGLPALNKADEKDKDAPSKEKLVGTSWEGNGKAGFTIYYEFMKDDKLKTVLQKKTEKYELEGTWQLKGSSLTITSKSPDGEKQSITTIKTLTDEKLVLVTETKEVFEFTRTKKK